MANRKKQMESLVEAMQEGVTIRPLSGHCASIATVADEEIGVDEFVGILEDPEDSALSDIVSHVGVKIDGVVYDGSGAYDSERDFVVTVVKDRKLLDDWEKHLWTGDTLPDVPYTKDMGRIRSAAQDAL